VNTRGARIPNRPRGRKQKLAARGQVERERLRLADLEVFDTYMLIFRARGGVGFLPRVDWGQMPVVGR
jgi:hypothetical protein